MTREEAINEIKSWDFLEGKEIEAIQTLIPELRESEDERIRKTLIEALKTSKTVGELKFIFPEPTREECIAYLEKQKECVADSSKTSANEDESIRKFLVDYFTSYKIGNVTTKLNGYKIDDILAYLKKQKENANSFTDGIIEVRSFQRGMKEGRRLEKKELNKMIVVSPEVWDNAISDAFENGKKEGEKQKESHYTKRNALFDKCVENCEPKTVEEVNKRVDDIMNMPELSAFEQALTNLIGYWEDDEEKWPSKFVKKHSKHILDMAREELQKEQKGIPLMNGDADLYFDEWNQQHSNPTKRECFEAGMLYAVRLLTEDSPMLEEFKKGLEQVILWGREGYKVSPDGTTKSQTQDEIDEVLDELFRDTTKMVEQKPAEWNEEDEDMLNSCISSIEEAKENRYAYKETDGDTSYDHEINWLKSLRTCPSWKPSEHQMNILKAIKDYVGKGSGYWGEGLGSLIEDLEKLR